MILYDTSVLIAASLKTHPRHDESLAAVFRANKRSACVSVHTLSELYSVLTRMPLPFRLPAEAALFVVTQVQEQMTMVTLSAREQYKVIRDLAERNLTGGLVHDAAILQCGRKAKATKVCTLNARHFRMIAPDLAEKIVEP